MRISIPDAKIFLEPLLPLEELKYFIQITVYF